MKVAVLFVAGMAVVARAGTEPGPAIKLSLESSPVISLEKPQEDRIVNAWGKPISTVTRQAERRGWSSRWLDFPGPGYRKFRQEPEDREIR